MSTSMSMSVKFLNPFIEAAAEVLEAEVGATIERGQIALEHSAYTTRDVTVLLSLVGQIEGLVLYGFPEETALNLVGQMMGEPIPEMDELAQSGIGELGNVITGRASIKLSQSGYESVISTPSLVLGSDVRISTLDFQRLAIPLETQYGRFDIHLALRESPASPRPTSLSP